MKWVHNIFLSERVVLFVIVLNAIVITWMSFPEYMHNRELHILDQFFIWFFILELIVKWQHLGMRHYFQDGWNTFDFLLVAASIPSILLEAFPNAMDFIPQTSLLLILRLFRLLRLFRFIRFIPHMNSIMAGIGRAMKASIFVFISLLFLNFMFALFTCHLYGELAPEYFGDPMLSAYTIFKMFTIEGWYEIPQTLAEKNSNPFFIWSMRLYFITIVMLGGILGMSLVNAIFVDEMTMDNNDVLEKKIDTLQAQIAELKAFIVQQGEEKNGDHGPES
jgi:voltage-gated sodium channel